MRPTFNPVESYFSDLVLIRLFKPSEDLQDSVGSAVFAVKGERILLKRLKKVQSEQGCWLESDAGKAGYYDSNIFGFVPPTCIKGKINFNNNNDVLIKIW